ncbi:MAG: hypothetical protein IIW31_05365 [Clostridia bacterium]|nr:hypothetical protein [Clostridia bacterium]
MELKQYRFPRGELICYEQQENFVSGEAYVLVMGSLAAPGVLKPCDHALRARISRDGVEAFRFNESDLREKKTDRDLYWVISDEGDGTVSLWSPALRRYVNLGDQSLTLSRKKQRLTLSRNGALLRFSVCINGTEYFLRAAYRSEAKHGLVFTVGTANASSSFAILSRVHGISKAPKGTPRLTAGTFADIHIDYGIQLFRPYVRRSAIYTAKGYQRRYDLDAVIMCGDSISDNGSNPGYIYGGAMQGKWGYDRFVKTRNLLHSALQESFRNPENKKHVFHLSGNHEYQVGDRQPEGKRFNSAYYVDLLPSDLMYPLYQKMDVDLGCDENLLCYEYRVKGIPFLVLNTPAYPLIEGKAVPERSTPAHTMEQAEWLQARLSEIEAELGQNAVIFVSSHYPFHPNSFGEVNAQVFLKMEGLLNRYPNLFYFYGHHHGGNQHPTLRETRENLASHTPVAFDGDVHPVESYDRARLRSDVIRALGFCDNYGGSMSYYKNDYFANDGKKKPTYLTHIEVPFFQGLAVQVYEDRVVLTMNNFGTKKGVSDHLPDSSYSLKPLVRMLKK